MSLALAGTRLTAREGALPRLGLAPPDDARERWQSTLLSLALHAVVLAGVLIAAALAPRELIEKVIPVSILREPAPLPGSNAEPAPAGPKAVGMARPSAAAMAAASLTPGQAAALRAAAMAAARRAIEEVQFEADTAPTLPAPIERSDVTARSLAARAAADVSPVVPVQRDVAPVRIDPADLAALDLDLSGPREIEASSLGDLSAPEALAALQAYEDRDYAASVRATTLGPGATLSGGGRSGGDVGVDIGVADAYGGGDGSGSGSGDGTLGAGGGGTGAAQGVVRCLESAAVVRYQEMMRQRTDARWRVPPDVPPDAAVVLRLSLDAAGEARDVEVVSAASQMLGDSAMQALLSASPFPPMEGANRCLADKRIRMTFTVPEP